MKERRKITFVELLVSWFCVALWQYPNKKTSPRSEMERGLSLYNLNTARYSANAVFISFRV